MASKQCRCGSTEHEAVTSRGLAGMTTITMCPLEIEAAREAMEKPVRMYSAVGVNGVKHYHDEEGWEERYQADIDKAEARFFEQESYSTMHLHYQLDMNQKGFSNITQHHLDKAQLRDMIDAIDSNKFVKYLKDDERFDKVFIHKAVISDPNNTLRDEHYDIFSDNKQLDMLLRTGQYQPYSKSPYIWRTVHLSDVDRHAVQMIMLCNDMKDTYTMMITEGEEE